MTTNYKIKIGDTLYGIRRGKKWSYVVLEVLRMEPLRKPGNFHVTYKIRGTNAHNAIGSKVGSFAYVNGQFRSVRHVLIDRISMLQFLDGLVYHEATEQVLREISASKMRDAEYWV